MTQVTIDIDCRVVRDERSVDSLGRTYEYFIGSLASSEVNRGGEFFTQYCSIISGHA
jgi:type I restriction-modification system DNA methylase subunit